LRTGFQLSSEKNYPAAADAFRRVIADNPKMVDAWEFLGRALQHMGKTEEALGAFQQGLKVSNGSPEIAVAAASLFFDLGRMDDAEVHAKMAMTAHPSFAHGLLANIAVQRKQLDVAEREAREAMTDQSLRVGPMITLAEVLHSKHDDAKALDMVRQAQQTYDQREAKDPDLIRGLNLIHGKILADQGDAAGAEAAFKKEIELFPDNVRGYSSLAILYALVGRVGEVTPLLQRMTEVNATPMAYAEAVKTLRILNDPRTASNLLRYAMNRFPGSPELTGLVKGG
jgi:tetratricopeptide (TPR) repeat protein